ncbi:MAG: SRPBCC family protein [Reichenbachiella sp.]|uniref:SRPBCC family protein n=1 Tax=Reichenbachiella sp. TaxID=2184521 RepID=UPI00326771F5
MTTYETNIVIAKSVDQVYQLISNPDRACEWITGLKKVELQSGNASEIGSMTKYVFEERGKEVTFMEELLSITPNAHFSFRLDSDQVVMESETHLKAIGNDNTEVMMSNAVAGKGFFMKLLMPLMKKSMINRQQKDLFNLKGLLENE